MKKKIHRWLPVGVHFIQEKIPEPVIPLEYFGVLAGGFDPKIMIKSLLKYCSCRLCSIYWLKELKNYG